MVRNAKMCKYHYLHAIPCAQVIERSIKTSAIVHFSIANQMEYDGAEVGGPGLWPIHTFQSTISTGSTVCMNLFTWEELYADRLSN